MLHVTHKTCLKVLCTALLAAATFIAVSISSTVNASTFDSNVVKKVAIKRAVIAARCGILAVDAKLPVKVIKAYHAVVDGYQENALVSYEVGYTIGVLDSNSWAKADSYGGVDEARKAAALYFYKTNRCQPYESI